MSSRENRLELVDSLAGPTPELSHPFTRAFPKEQFRSPFPVLVQITLADGSQFETLVLSNTGHIEGYFEDGMGVQYMLTALQDLELKQ